MAIPNERRLSTLPEEVVDQIGVSNAIAYEKERHQEDLAYWAMAAESKSGQIWAELAEWKEAVVQITGLQDYAPIHDFPDNDLERMNGRRS